MVVVVVVVIIMIINYDYDYDNNDNDKIAQTVYGRSSAYGIQIKVEIEVWA